mmetsp:Transcript_2985/g.12320  ORF Transcript_2985/g.12320 Transcript_2985/m.12320 type:complete len:202 (-) Transcript_2985:310-915(-)
MVNVFPVRKRTDYNCTHTSSLDVVIRFRLCTRANRPVCVVARRLPSGSCSGKEPAHRSTAPGVFSYRLWGQRKRRRARRPTSATSPRFFSDRRTPRARTRTRRRLFFAPLHSSPAGSAASFVDRPRPAPRCRRTLKPLVTRSTVRDSGGSTGDTSRPGARRPRRAPRAGSRPTFPGTCRVSRTLEIGPGRRISPCSPSYRR